MTPTKLAGFTLIELLIIVAIIGILTGYGFTGFTQLTQRTVATSVANEMRHHFAFARSSAIYQGTLVTLCAIDEDNHCTADWKNTLMIFNDRNNNRTLDLDELVLRTLAAPKQGFWRAKPANKGYFQFDSIGTAHGTLGSVTWCPDDKNNHHAVQLLLNLGGRLRQANDSNGDGIAEDSKGKPLSCTD